MNKQKRQNKSKGIVFFWIIILFVYVLIFVISPDIALASVKETCLTLIKMIPILFVIFIVMILVNLFVTPERVKKHFGEESGLRGWFWAIIFGILVSGPPYTLYPMLKTMKEHGLSNKFIATFLYNRNVKIPLIPASVYYFGWRYTFVMMFLIMIFSIFSGLLLSRVDD